MNKSIHEIYAGFTPKVQPEDTKKVFSAIVVISCILGCVAICLFSSCGVTPARAEFSNEAIVNAIWVIEGGHKAQYAYGIRSVRYSSLAEARRICYNTVRNNRVRFAKQNRYTDYLDFLASRYCPISGKLSNAEQRLNKFWIGNLRNQLARQPQ